MAGEIVKGTIYKITNQKNGLVYIGQTVQTFKRRMRSHISHLQAGTHHNELLQRAYNKYGIDAFSFEIVETCDKDILDERERYWIKFYDSTNRSRGYNFESGGSVLKKHSPETIQKFIYSSRGENNKLTKEQVVEIKKSIINGSSFKEISERYGVTISCVYQIKNLGNWQYVAPELNEKLIATDTSRHIPHMSESDIESCKCRLLNGEAAYTLSQEYGIDYRRFSRFFEKEISSVKNDLKSAKELAQKLFMKNESVKDVLAKTGLTYPQYKRATKGLEEIRHNRNVKYTMEAKKKGLTNREIAEKLNVNRCTISVFIKEYSQK